jgi:hypothetical protein
VSERIPTANKTDNKGGNNVNAQKRIEELRERIDAARSEAVLAGDDELQKRLDHVAGELEVIELEAEVREVRASLAED